MKLVRILLITLFAFTLPTCEHRVTFDTRQFDTATRLLERIMDLIPLQVDKATEALKELQQSAHTLISDDVHSVLNRSVATLGQQPRQFLVFLEHTLKAQLRQFTEALAEGKKEVQEAIDKQDKSALERALEKISKRRIQLDPYLCQVDPDVVTIEWDHKHSQYTLPKPILRFKGWGFQPSGARSPFRVSVRGWDKGNERYLVDTAVAIVGPEDGTINLKAGTFEFANTDAQVVLSSATDPDVQAVLTINTIVKEAPKTVPPPPQKLRLWFLMTEPREFKDKHYGFAVEVKDKAGVRLIDPKDHLGYNKDDSSFEWHKTSKNFVDLGQLNRYVMPGEDITVEVKAVHYGQNSPDESEARPDFSCSLQVQWDEKPLGNAWSEPHDCRRDTRKFPMFSTTAPQR